jgi:hypothetical protein
MVGKDDTGCRERPTIVAQKQLFDHIGKEGQQTGFLKDLPNRARRREESAAVEINQSLPKYEVASWFYVVAATRF